MKEITLERNLFLFVLLVLLAGALYLNNPRFLSGINLSNVLIHNTPLALIAFGMTFVILTGGIDLSVGSILGLSACAVGMALEAGWSVTSSFLAGLGVGMLCGSFNGLLITAGRMPPILVTLGAMMLFRGLAFGFTGGEDMSGFPAEASLLGNSRFLGLPWHFWMGLAVFALCVVLRHTVWGRSVYAMGGNETAARLAGMAVDRDKFLVYLLIGWLSALAALLYTSRVGSVRANEGEWLELQAITCVVLGGASIFGGRGTLWGTALGVALLAVLQNGMNLLGVVQEWQTVATGLLLIAVIAINERVSWSAVTKRLGLRWGRRPDVLESRER